MTDDESINADRVRQRAATAGITLDEDLIGEVAMAMEIALAPLRHLDPRLLSVVEPAVTFDARNAGDIPDARPMPDATSSEGA